MKSGSSPHQIVQQQIALDSYLRTLLETVPEADDVVLELEQTVDVLPRVETRPVELLLEKNPVVTLTQPLVQPAAEAKLHPLTVMPEWSQHEFQALFFKVEHLILATPLVELSRTINIERKIGKIPGQPSWFIGLLDDQDSRIGVLDTGQLVFGKTRGSRRNLEDNPFKRILITQDKRWGLACDEILSIGRLRPDKVRWRTSRQKRPWLIGTVIDELTAVIDVKALVPHRS